MSFFSPVAGSRVNATPVPDSSFKLPNTIEQIRDRDIVDFRLDYEFENVEGYYPSGKRNKPDDHDFYPLKVQLPRFHVQHQRTDCRFQLYSSL